MADSPLNPDLYQSMVAYFGEVQIHNAGEANSWGVVWCSRFGEGRRYPRREMHRAGEEYLVCCKECKDYRPRLYINHMWGVLDDETQSRNLWLANCFHQQCYTDFDNQRWLYESLYTAPVRRRPGAKINILPGRVYGPLKLQKVKWPGGCIPLVQLAESFPDHPAITYLAGRGFDPGKLSRLYDVRYCPSSEHRWASNRIVIPFYQKDMLVGWQARHIGDDVGGVPFNSAKVPKYYTAPGMPKRLVAYNIERALLHPTIIIVEGPADVWNTGRMATALLGKTISREVLQLIVDGMKPHGDKAVIVVALDPKQDKLAAEKKRPHHIERATSKLVPAFGNRVVPVYLPEQFDPGSIDRALLRDIIRNEAGKRGLRVTFSKPGA